MAAWIGVFEQQARAFYPDSDPSHDMLHIRRVVNMARRIGAEEGADENIVIPAAYFHDCVNVPKNDPRRKEASRLSADAAIDYLRAAGYAAQYFDAIHHAIAAHSFSAGIAPQTLEAKVVQDADRLDGLGAIGIARLFTVAGLLQRPYYDAHDPQAQAREHDDTRFSIDHFHVKLFKTAQGMQTASGRAEAARRADYMKSYLVQLASEI